MSKSCSSDALIDTISYADVCNLVKQEMKIASKLLEHAAKRIIDRLKEEYPQVEGVELKLSKRNPPMGAQVDSASVMLIDGEV